MAYFLKQVKQKSGRIFLEIVDSIYVKRKKASKHVVFKKIGYLDELEKTFKDPITYFKKEASDLEEKIKESLYSQIPVSSPVKNFGFLLLFIYLTNFHFLMYLNQLIILLKDNINLMMLLNSLLYVELLILQVDWNLIINI